MRFPIGLPLLGAILAFAAAGPSSADNFLDEIRRRAEAGAPDCPCPPCEEEESGPGGINEINRLANRAHGCYEPSRLDSHPATQPCTDFYGFICGPRDRFEAERRAETDRKAQIIADAQNLAAAAMDVIAACLGSSSKTITYPRSGDDASQTLSCSGIRLPQAQLTRIRAASLEAIQAAKAAGNTDEAARLIAERNELAQDLKGRAPPVGELFHKVHVLASFGRIPGAGGASLSSRVRERYSAVQSRFRDIKAAYLSRLGDPARSPELTTDQRNLILRLIEDADIAPPEAYMDGEFGRDAWQFCERDHLNAAMDDEWSYDTHDSSGAPHHHRHGMLMCPTTFLNVSDAWLEGVIAHEIGHVMEPRALAFLRNRYLTPEYLDDTTQPAADRDYYRSLGTRDTAAGALRALYGEASPDFVWGADPLGLAAGTKWWPVPSGPRPDAAVTEYPAGSYGACQEAFSHCPDFEFAGIEGRAARLRNNCASDHRAVNCNDLACDPCFQLDEGQAFETAADELGGRMFADVLQSRLNSRLGTLSAPLNPPDPRTVSDLREAFGLHCMGGDVLVGHSEHAAGPARILRVLSAQILDGRPQLRRALGCPDGGGSSAYESVCRIGNHGGRRVPTSGSRCIGSSFVCPSDAGLE